ncbi:hypothetical protein [Flavobacterium subsaxonicum]|uniref:Uncharacterized protein n=1 Tax=Flavobacterium subsaxonicum WB 4.1-42 = DSM 21790 TaxID=1121898 RepID=A0A0A2MGA7_9FLAO|nr:hypothetical protein [Flavobacterium subsaxonicum]KGO91314.1 hypothetical protein Q766_18730 [Flavobacterium subsaxonicum WB 4.1-42 = DSM 21790]
MKKSEVPQDKSNISSVNMRELCYATDDNGNYTTELSSGWEPKTIALSNAIEDIKERTEAARQQVINGELSPIVYFMELSKMDLGILAGYTGIWQWRIKRHFKPKVFAGLSNKVLQKYATAFLITAEELKNFKG